MYILQHPGEAVDLCAIPFDAYRIAARDAGMPLSLGATNVGSRPKDGEWENFHAVQEVVMIGYPNALWDDYNNLPIIRRGITATPIWASYQGREEFLIDMACFPGSSGSPVFSYTNAYSFRGTKARSAIQIFVIGILYAGPVITNSGKVVLGTAGQVEVDTMLHLGQVIRASAMTAIEDVIYRAAGAMDDNRKKRKKGNIAQVGQG